MINDREQAAGAAFAGEIICAECGDDEVAFGLDFTKAYPVEAQLKRGVRRLTLRKSAGELRIEDEFELASVGSVESAFVTDAPVVSIVGDREAVVEKAGIRLRLRAVAGLRWDRVESRAFRNYLWQDASTSRLVLGLAPKTVGRVTLAVDLTHEVITHDVASRSHSAASAVAAV